ncbi:hypothetical protein PGT21_025003 [Puccinia graminis f. sp. tritici]|uniref:DUF6589 domain-containing protein n=1 Tax=Puccinia graminis f. sp. tritici TaxID=56615 RepID=A0A5B0LQ59_PUCGR|nr:hypothetical protein PGT21_025003 [Puccinia graminis f. sp. tritici]
MPFLYNLVHSKLQVGRNGPSSTDDQDEDSESETSDNDTEEVEFDIGESKTVECGKTERAKAWVIKRNRKSYVMAKTICSMVAFGQSRRCNALQVWNSVVLLACGVTERVNSYLHYLGLTSSRKTGHRALASLSEEARKLLRDSLSVNSCDPLSPIICLDNIDFEEKVHSKSPEKTNHMFHGTWGYIHRIDRKILKDFDQEDFSIKRYKEDISRSAQLDVTPAMLIPSFEENEHFSQVIKSQIAQVLMKYLATGTDSKSPIALTPPPITQIKAQKPNIQMLKLMIASDNSAEGVGNMLEDIVRQSSLTQQQYHSELQLLEADLGSVLNLESLRSQRKPSGHVETNLGNTFMLLGAAHTLWNISKAIFLLHFGNRSNCEDLGAWSTLQALGLPSDRPLAKNDFTLMITNLRKVHEATLIHCLLYVISLLFYLTIRVSFVLE